MPRTLILYSTTDGHTRAICERIRAVVETAGDTVELGVLDPAAAPDLAGFDRILIGASIRYGHHHPAVYAFIRRHAAQLATRQNAFFSVSLVARKAERRSPDTNPYLRRFLREIPWRPTLVTVFAGKLDYPRYGFWDRQIIRLIMRLTGGPTDPRAVVDYTDWAEVEAFARRFAGQATGDPHRPPGPSAGPATPKTIAVE